LPQDDRRINLIIADGAEYIQACNKTFDLILVDGFDQYARAGALDTLPFYQACRAHLTDDGIMAVNILGRSRGFDNSLARIYTAFEDRALLLPSCESGNVIILAAAGKPVEISLVELKQNALTLKKETGLNLLPTLTRLTQAKTCLSDLLII
jgi:spermidine synthase